MNEANSPGQHQEHQRDRENRDHCQLAHGAPLFQVRAGDLQDQAGGCRQPFQRRSNGAAGPRGAAPLDHRLDHLTGRWLTRTTSTGSRTSRTDTSWPTGTPPTVVASALARSSLALRGVADPDRGAAIGLPELARLDPAETAGERGSHRVDREPALGDAIAARARTPPPAGCPRRHRARRRVRGCSQHRSGGVGPPQGLGRIGGADLDAHEPAFTADQAAEFGLAREVERERPGSQVGHRSAQCVGECPRLSVLPAPVTISCASLAPPVSAPARISSSVAEPDPAVDAAGPERRRCRLDPSHLPGGLLDCGPLRQLHRGHDDPLVHLRQDLARQPSPSGMASAREATAMANTVRG